MRIFLMLSGAAICVAALLWWLYLNALAAGWATGSGTRPSTQWLTGEALVWFWLPFAAGAAIAVIGWRRR